MVHQYRAIWSVPGGGTGYSIFHAEGVVGPIIAQDWADLVRLLMATQSQLPNDVTITFDTEVTEYSTVTGILVGASPVTPPASVVGTAVGGWAGGAGGRYTWETGEIIAGKRLRGRTYIVPLPAANYDPDGTLTSGTVTLFNAQATNYIASCALIPVTPVVWSRTHGVSHEILSGAMKDKTAILRSRRDG